MPGSGMSCRAVGVSCVFEPPFCRLSDWSAIVPSWSGGPGTADVPVRTDVVVGE